MSENEMNLVIELEIYNIQLKCYGGYSYWALANNLVINYCILPCIASVPGKIAQLVETQLSQEIVT